MTKKEAARRRDEVLRHMLGRPPEELSKSDPWVGFSHQSSSGRNLNRLGRPLVRFPEEGRYLSRGQFRLP
jgi:hypothetical protein